MQKVFPNIKEKILSPHNSMASRKEVRQECAKQLGYTMYEFNGIVFSTSTNETLFNWSDIIVELDDKKIIL